MMFQYSLEEAGQRLIEQRRALQEAEANFQTQYEEAKRSLHAQSEHVKSHLEEQERKTRELFLRATESELSDQQRGELQHELDESFETVRGEFEKNERLFKSYLEEAARIISAKAT